MAAARFACSCSALSNAACALSTACCRAFAVLLPGGLFARPFTLAPLLLLFEGESGLSFRSLVDGARGRLLRLWAFRLAGGFRWSSAAKIGGQLGMFAERSVGSNRAPENDAGLCHGRRDNVRVVALLRRTLVEEIAVCGAAIARSKKPSEVW
jgi:hypothetical protein